MKITAFLILAVMLQVSASSFGQKVSLSEKNAQLEQVLKKIKQQTGYDLLYGDNVLSKDHKITVNVKNVTLTEALDQVLEDQKLSYSIKERTIIIREKEQSFLDKVKDVTLNLFQGQAIDVRGKVVDSLGNGLAGANVTVKNGKGSINTLANGDFLLKNVEEGAILQISYLGFVTKEVPVSKEFMYIALQQSSSKLDEVQVMAYGLTSRRLSTGNIVTIKAADIAKQPINNPLLALQGRVPNLMITPASGLPGAAVKLQLRGQNSLHPTSKISQPLIIIDGVPFENNIGSPTADNGDIAIGGGNSSLSAFSFVNPGDIESIDVLSDADATSIYGSRGGNGVIVITTKKGGVGKTSVNIGATTGISKNPKKLNLLNTAQYLEMRREAFANDGIQIPTDPNEFNRTNYDLTLWDQNQYTDWQEVFLGGTAQYSNVNASISGGTSTMKYLLSGTFLSNGANNIYPGQSKWQSGTGHFSLSGNTINQKLRVTLNGTYTLNNDFTPGRTGFAAAAIALAPNAPERYKNNELNWAPNPLTGESSWGNPFSELLNTTDVKTATLYTGLDFQYRILPYLSFSSTFGISEVRLHSTYLSPRNSKKPEHDSTFPGGHSRYYSISNSMTFDPRLEFRRNIFKGNLSVLAGASFQNQLKEDETVSAAGFESDAMLHNLRLAQRTELFNTSSEYKYAGLFARINYDFDNKYIINLSGRRDGSSRFGPGNQYGNFWAVGTAWIFSSENWAKRNLSWLSFGKLRSSYGTSGNDGIGDYKYLQLYKPLDNVSYLDGKTIIANGVSNPYYRWESIKKFESAIELGFFKEKLLLMASYWNTISGNQLGDLPLPATGGAVSLFVNRDARIKNYGYDFQLLTRNVGTKNFSWQSSLNLGVARNKLLALPEEFGYFSPFGYASDRTYAPERAVGKPFSGVQLAYGFRGVDSETGVAQYLTYDGGIATNLTTNYAEISPFSRIIYNYPKFSGGINNSLNYRGVSLDFFFQFIKQTGKNYIYDDVFNRNSAPGFFDQNFGNQPVEVFSRWRKNGDLTNQVRFTTLADPYLSLIKQSDVAWVDASFLRLKTVVLSYALPTSLLKKLNIHSAVISLTGQNLFTITPYKGLDPEVQNLGVLQQLRTVSAGFNIGF